MPHILIFSEDQDTLERIVNSMETKKPRIRFSRPNAECQNTFSIVSRKYVKDDVKYYLCPFYYNIYQNIIRSEDFVEWMHNGGLNENYGKIIYLTHSKVVNTYGGEDGVVIDNIQRAFSGKQIKLISLHESDDDKRKQIRDFCC